MAGDLVQSCSQVIGSDPRLMRPSLRYVWAHRVLRSDHNLWYRTYNPWVSSLVSLRLETKELLTQGSHFSRSIDLAKQACAIVMDLGK